MKFARNVFLVAGIYGLLVIVPLFFLEGIIDVMQPPAITHPEYYYGFAGVALIWQILFLVLARDPLRYRPMMLMCVLEKATAIAFVVLFLLHRAPVNMFIAAIPDTILGILFLVSYIKTASVDVEQSVVAHS